MTNLFRPWAEGLLQQDCTVSTTTEKPHSLDDVKTREMRFKNVKEHVRKRNEKKKLRKAESLVNPEKTECATGADIVPVDTVVPATDYPPGWMLGSWPPYLLDALNKDRQCCEELSPELLEIALGQGLPPSLVEEYARLLTEQQRHATERSRKQRPKKFRCPHCQVGFSNNGQLKGHIRIHTGERPFKCDAESCGKSFTRNEELTRHRRIHSGLRPFPCPDCGKRFGRKDHLKKHIRTHYQQRYQLVPILPISSYHCLYGY